MIVYDVFMYAYLLYYVYIVRFCTYICIYIYIQDGCTALIRAAACGYIEIADLLIRSYADVNVKNEVRTNTIYIIYIPQTTSTVHIYVQIYKYTLIYIQNTYEYIHMILQSMLIKLLICIYTLHLAFYENFINCQKYVLNYYM